jgi:hypothetical protein
MRPPPWGKATCARSGLARPSAGTTQALASDSRETTSAAFGPIAIIAAARNRPPLGDRPCRQEQKKPTWSHAQRHSTTSAYSLTSPSAPPSCPLSSHPTTFHRSTCRPEFQLRCVFLLHPDYTDRSGKGNGIGVLCLVRPHERLSRTQPLATQSVTDLVLRRSRCRGTSR